MKIGVYHFEGPNKKDYDISGSPTYGHLIYVTWRPSVASYFSKNVSSFSKVMFSQAIFLANSCDTIKEIDFSNYKSLLHTQKNETSFERRPSKGSPNFRNLARTTVPWL